MTNEIATREPNKAAELVTYFQGNSDKFAALMPATDVPKFMRVVANAIMRDPDIAKASKQSIFLECQKAAADGLVLDGREAVLTRFNSNKRIQQGGKWVDNWQTEVVYIPMIRGLRKIVSEAPQVKSWNTGIVYEQEFEQNRFDYQSGDDPKLFHKPIIMGERGPVVAAYSIVVLRNGQVSIEVMTRGQLDKIKNRTKSRKRAKQGEEGEITGPWASDPDEMYIKTVARRHFKRLPLTDKSEAFERVDNLYDATDFDDEAMPIAPAPKSVTNKAKTSAAAKLKDARPQPGPDSEGDPKGDDDAEVVDHDPETGEIVEEGNQQEDDEF